MSALTYVRLIGFTAGTLLMLFWMVVILGYRRQRNFERVFFFLCLALFFFYAGSLLALNAQIFYSLPPQTLSNFAAFLIGAGLIFLPPVLFHMHLEFASTRGMTMRTGRKGIALGCAYLPAIYFLTVVLPARIRSHEFDFAIPGNSLGAVYVGWLFLLILFSCAWEQEFAHEMAGKPERKFHRLAWAGLAVALLLLCAVHLPFFGFNRFSREVLATVLSLSALPPFVALIYFVQRHNFLNIGRQKNLLYAVSATFVALLYLALVRRISEWFSPILPPEATAAILLFALVIFIEPLQRLLGRRLQETAQREMDRVQQLLTDIQFQARQGNEAAFAQFIEKRITSSFELAALTFSLKREFPVTEKMIEFARNAGYEGSSVGKPRVVFSEGKMGEAFLTAGNVIGVLRVEPYGSSLSGETRAAMEFLCEQLPTAIDLCRAVDEKAQLERELAERERLALVGQTAASISHNLKNPLGSIKTILQVQLENPELPESMRAETKMILEEISRLSAKLNQLLQFSRPAIRAGEVASVSDAASVLREVVAVLRPEAERRGISLHLKEPEDAISVEAGAEAVNDILSNLIVNALEATSSGGTVSAGLNASNGHCLITIEDDGPGIPPSIREKILQPFFTTKSQGTGLGLAIAARRVSEFSGKLEFSSPISAGRGTRFEITLPLIQEAS
jgi:signal transduction histidine kinase